MPVRQLLHPAPPTAPRPAPASGEGRYVRSFLVERLIIGGLSVVLPFALVFLDWGAFSERPLPRDSLSAYYYSGMREWFVLSLGTTGFFLIAYKITESNLVNSLQNLLGEKTVQYVHFAASGVFIISLGVICVLFGRREGVRRSHGNHLPQSFWRLFHFACAGMIAVAGVWILLTQKIVDGPYWSLLAGETACALAFGASWFAKGAELRYVFGQPASAAN